MRYAYILEKIRAAPFSTAPFEHLQIDDFFDPADFAVITAAPEFATVDLRSDEALFRTLLGRGFKIIDFPGCITEKDRYLDWHRERGRAERRKDRVVHSACEGFGMTLRLVEPGSAAILELNAFLNSLEFQEAIAGRFGIAMDDVFYDAGIQKYLDGYEISPHPDIRRKALTYMVNLNTHPESEGQDHHTHYLRFKPEFEYVRSYWEGHPERDRCWVPWSWCETVKMQRANNSIVIFSPNNRTMHGVKTNYDHLQSQRTQLYGNLWYHEARALPGPEWEDFVIAPRPEAASSSLKTRIKSALPELVRGLVSDALHGKNVIGNRLAR